MPRAISSEISESERAFFPEEGRETKGFSAQKNL